MQKKAKRVIEHIGIYAIILSVLFVCLFPVYWMVSTSFKPYKDYYTYPPVYLPFNFSWENYKYVINRISLAVNPPLLNSIIIASVNTFISLIVGALAAYALSRYHSKWNEHISFWILSIRMLPPIATAIPLFLLMKFLKLLDTHFSLIIAYFAFNLPLVVWMMRGFFQEIPLELDESAMIDGCSRIGVLFRIIIPVTAPGMAATGAFSFIFSWNEFLLALLFTRNKAMTAPVEVSLLQLQIGPMWGQLSAYSVIAMAPILVIAIYMQKYLIKGLTFGVIKG